MAFSLKNYSSNESRVKKNKLVPGYYESIVTDVVWDDGYVEGTAFRVEYRLKDAEGNSFDYKEIFYNTSRNKRTAEFLQYLNEQGINVDDIGAFVGKKERLNIRKAPRQGSALLTIASREFLA